MAKTIIDNIDAYFKISARKSTIGQEIRGGLVTFFALAYIVVLNPIIIGGVPGSTKNQDIFGAILPASQVAAATALIAGVMTIIFGFIANLPFALAAGLGINSLLAVTAISQLTWPEAMGLVVLDGVIIVLLAVTGLRTAVFSAIPPELKAAISVGIGCFVTFIGLVDAGFVRRVPDSAGTTVPVEMGTHNSIASYPIALFVLGVVLIGVLTIRKTKGAFLIGILIVTILAIIVQKLTHHGSIVNDPGGWSLNIPDVPNSLGSLPDLSLLGNVDIFGAFHRVGLISAITLLFTIVLSNFFDAMGTMAGLGKEAELEDSNGQLPNITRALIVEGSGAIVGGAASISSNTVFVESAAGIAEGARTGLASVVTGFLFLLSMFFTPIYRIIPTEAAAPALIVVGALMVAQIRSIDLTRLDYALPTFLTIVVMPFTYSIANGIGVGFITWVIVAIAQGKARTINPVLWTVSALFVVYFAKVPIEHWLHHFQH